ncbi:MAG: acetyl/propionyl/methylcrotonyl-CoA carboxylase subunit alpha [Pseudomonadota bacterium]
MLKKLLIANRGEIACRVIRTAKRLGLDTVAVYSDADAGALHVEMADEAIRLGPPPVAESYLLGDAIIEAARVTGADAIHPGYGFLSENPDFVAAVEASGIRFVGPSADAIRAMGLKDAAKRLMTEAGVPVVPGYHGDNQDPGVLEAEAEKIGYPVLIKARAGGGGKGMRRVEEPTDFRSSLESAQREAQASFGDDACLIEKWVEKPRHIEVQVFGDDHGNAVYLFERDCSLQRRMQKVIEEAPAPGMPKEMRAAMGEAAVRAAKAISYSGAGTIEFIVDSSEGLRPDRFYFMEMNTRLQVEHPVTELITGQDLVEWQLRVAAGEVLPLAQADLRIDGWAFEARLYAEDAAKGFLPATGKLGTLYFAGDDVRIDSGVRTGDEITPFYDPMIAKVITHGRTRAAALGKLRKTLAESHVVGTVTNLDFLAALAGHEGFGRGEVDTGLIGRDLDKLLEQPTPTIDVMAIAALTALGLNEDPISDDPWHRLSGWCQWLPAKQHVVLESKEGTSVELDITLLPGKTCRVEHGTEVCELRIFGHEDGRLRLRIDNHLRTARALRCDRTIAVLMGGAAYEFTLPDPLAGSDHAEASGDRLIAPMPGLVRVVSTEPGKEVAKGDPLIVLEAMKMEHALPAPRDGRIAEVFVSVGDQVADGAILMALEQDDGAA